MPEISRARDDVFDIIPIGSFKYKSFIICLLLKFIQILRVQKSDQHWKLLQVVKYVDRLNLVTPGNIVAIAAKAKAAKSIPPFPQSGSKHRNTQHNHATSPLTQYRRGLFSVKHIVHWS